MEHKHVGDWRHSAEMDRDYDYLDFQEIDAEIGVNESAGIWDDASAEAQAEWEAEQEAGA